jgi:hypothetical protein
MLDKADNKNVSKRFREGWEPVPKEQVRELKVMNDIGSQWADGVEVGGLLLCRAPEELVQKKRDYLRRKSAEQLRSVDENYMRDSNPNMRKFAEKQTRTEFGKG